MVIIVGLRSVGLNIVSPNALVGAQGCANKVMACGCSDPAKLRRFEQRLPCAGMLRTLSDHGPWLNRIQSDRHSSQCVIEQPLIGSERKSDPVFKRAIDAEQRSGRDSHA